MQGLKNYYDDVDILYSFTSNIGDGYCIKKFLPGEHLNRQVDLFSTPKAFYKYFNNDFTINEDFNKKRKDLLQESKANHNGYTDGFKEKLNLKKEIVKDQIILAKFSLIIDGISRKQEIMINLKKLQEKINNDIDVDKIHNGLIQLLGE